MIDVDAIQQRREISIHAPCTGSDSERHDTCFDLEISIHAPCTGSDGVYRHHRISYKEFQSTLPARGATNSSQNRSFTNS